MLHALAPYRNPNGYYHFVSSNFNPKTFYHWDDPAAFVKDYGSNGDSFVGESLGITFRTPTIIPSEPASFSRTGTGLGILGSLSPLWVPWSTSQSLSILCPINCPYPVLTMGIIHQGNNDESGGQGYQVFLTPTGQIGYYAFDSGYQIVYSSPGAWPASTPCLLGMTEDAGADTVEFFVNGVSVGLNSGYSHGTSSSTSVTGSVLGSQNPSTGTTTWTGAIQGLAIIDTPLTSTDHLNTYNAYL